jgi:adenylate kinase family enzyme
MTRIAVIGNAGGGKSTLSRKLRDLLKLPLYPVDQMQWLPGWQRVSEKDFLDTHTSLLSQPRWIIDGWGNCKSIEERFQASDTIVLVDFPLWRHYWWALKRQFMCIFRPRIDGPPGCPMLPMTWPLIKMLWAINKYEMPRLRQLVKSLRHQKTVITIQKLSDLRSFIRQVENHAKKA